MKGLILKDLYSMRSYQKILLLLAVIVIGMCTIGNFSTVYIPNMFMVYLLMMSVTIFSSDEACNFDRAAISMPLSRKQIVTARYLTLLILLALIAVLGFALTAAISLVKGTTGWLAETGAGLGLLLLIILFVTSLIFPLSYKVGTEKARYVMVLIFIAPYLLVFSLLPHLQNWVITLSAGAQGLLVAAAALFIVGMFVGSYFLSQKIYAKREF